MFRRPLGRPLRRAMLGNVPPALRRANQLMAAGQFEPAAEIFEQFANAAEARNGPRAPWFFLQAAQARLKADQWGAGMAHLRRGLSILAGRGQFQRLANAGMRFVTELKAMGHLTEAEAIEAYLKSALPAGFTARTEPVMQATKRVLPTHCPGCGAPIRSDEVEWADELTAECPYCGSAVRTEQTG